MEMIDDENIDGLEKKYREFVDNLYRELLLRPADKIGLDYFTSLLMNKTATTEDVRKLILDSEEVKNIQSFSHYSFQYWNDLDEVEHYMNKLCTGDPKVNWMMDTKKRFKQYLPFGKVLVVGCGNGWVERELSDLEIGLHFDAFDISEEYIQIAKKEKEDRPINYFVADINNMENIENKKYDAVINYAILHHAVEIEYAIKKIANVLKPNGLMFNLEYVGPARNQYTDEHVSIMKEVMSRIPERLQSKYPLRPPIENFRVEPTEAIHSDLVRSTFEKYFDIVYQRDLNGGIAYQILWNNVKGFMDKFDTEAYSALKMLLETDNDLTQSKRVPVLFWYSVGRPKLETND